MTLRMIMRNITDDGHIRINIYRYRLCAEQRSSTETIMYYIGVPEPPAVIYILLLANLHRHLDLYWLNVRQWCYPGRPAYIKTRDELVRPWVMLLHSTVISYRGHRCCIYKQNSLATVTKGNENE